MTSETASGATAPHTTFLYKPGFLSAEVCAQLIRDSQRMTDESSGCAGCGGIRLQPNRTEIEGTRLARKASDESKRVLRELRSAALQEVEAFFGASELNVEFTLLTEMREGDAHPLHADNARQLDEGQWVPNHTPWRAYAAMVYLNTSGGDYAGGVLRFPAIGAEVVPRAGDLVGFSCGNEHEHEVTPIARGRRYSISIWLTRDRARTERWP